MRKTAFPAALLAAFLIMSLLTGCGSALPLGKGADSDTLRIVTTIFPVFDWTREVLGDRIQETKITMLLSSGVDLHSFQPTAADILEIADCDMFIYVGGESDDWVADALSEATNDHMIVLNLMEALGDRAREEELVEGMTAGEEEREEDEPEYDEHIWLSLRNAEYLCGKIAAALSETDPDNATVYMENAAAYSAELSSLDERFVAAVEDSTVDTLVFGDRFPFRYLTDDYGLTYYAAFSGCSAESEASFETILFLAGKVDELGLTHVMTIEGADHRIAETIIDTTGTKDQTILELDSMQSITAKDVEAGTSYLVRMEHNLDVLRDALR